MNNEAATKEFVQEVIAEWEKEEGRYTPLLCIIKNHLEQIAALRTNDGGINEV